MGCPHFSCIYYYVYLYIILHMNENKVNIGIHKFILISLQLLASVIKPWRWPLL